MTLHVQVHCPGQGGADAARQVSPAPEGGAGGQQQRGAARDSGHLHCDRDQRHWAGRELWDRWAGANQRALYWLLTNQRPSFCHQSLSPEICCSVWRETFAEHLGCSNAQMQIIRGQCPSYCTAAFSKHINMTIICRPQILSIFIPGNLDTQFQLLNSKSQNFLYLKADMTYDIFCVSSRMSNILFTFTSFSPPLFLGTSRD